jgi:dihydrolipoamide dehydrogenase
LADGLLDILRITLGAKAEVLADMINPHPALNEAIWEAIAGRVIYIV